MNSTVSNDSAELEAGSPLVSVIIVNWNRSELLRSCLRSLQTQAGITFEVIVIDNGSTDSSTSVVQRFSEEVTFRVRLITNVTNHGFCAANNQGIAAAEGQYIALLNNDAEANPGWLLAMVQAIDQRPDVGMVASKILVYEAPGKIDKAGHLIWPDGQNRGRGTGESDTGQYDRVEEVLWPDGCAALYRKTMLDEIGGFDEDLFAYGDDAELGLRARIAGWKCIYTPSAVVRHRRGSTLGVFSSRRIQLIERNRVLLAVKHFPLSLLAQNVPWFLARLWAGAVAGIRGRGEASRFAGLGEKLRLSSALLRGFGSGVAMIPKTWRKRRQFAPHRRLTPRQVRELIFQNRISLKALSEGVH